MGNYERLITALKEVVKPNGAGEITGTILQNALVTMVTILGQNATFAGIARPTTAPGLPDGNVVYFANTPGVYSNFGNITIGDGELAVLYSENERWVHETLLFMPSTSEFVEYSKTNTIGEFDNPVLDIIASTLYFADGKNSDGDPKIVNVREAIRALQMLISELSALKGLGKHIGENPNLDSIKETGFYTYTHGGTKYNLIVQNYPGRYVVQYQFTANNINRRYAEHPQDGNLYLFTAWRTVAQDGYDPNTQYMTTAKAIKQGLKDATNGGLRIGNVLNGRYLGVSELDMSWLHDRVINERLEDFEKKVILKRYDFTKENLLTITDNKDSNVKYTEDNVFQINQYNCGQAWMSGRGIGFGPNQWFKINVNNLGLTDNRDIVAVVEAESYGGNYGTCYYSLYGSSDAGKVSADYGFAFFPSEDGKGLSGITGTTYSRIKKVYILRLKNRRIEVSKDILSSDGMRLKMSFAAGDSVALLFAIKHLNYAGSKFEIGEGHYYIGRADEGWEESPYTSAWHISGNDIEIAGAGIDKTFIHSTYLESGSVVAGGLKITGKFTYLHDFTAVSEYAAHKDEYLQCPTINDSGTDTIYKRCGIIGGQDTLVTGVGSHYFEDCYIEGTVDFICGGGNTEYVNRFSGCALVLKRRAVGNTICAPMGAFTFINCNIKQTDYYENSQDGKYSLGRAWGDGSVLFYIGCKFNILPIKEGYTVMDPNAPSTNFSAHGEKDSLNIKGKPIEPCVPIDTTTDIYRKFVISWQDLFEDKDRLIAMNG